MLPFSCSPSIPFLILSIKSSVFLLLRVYWSSSRVLALLRLSSLFLSRFLKFLTPLPSSLISSYRIFSSLISASPESNDSSPSLTVSWLSGSSSFFISTSPSSRYLFKSLVFINPKSLAKSLVSTVCLKFYPISLLLLSMSTVSLRPMLI